jgi:hypothetical protein
MLIRPGETEDSRGTRGLRTAVRDADPGIFGIAAYVVLAAVYAGRLVVNRAGFRADAAARAVLSYLIPLLHHDHQRSR